MGFVAHFGGSMSSRRDAVNRGNVRKLSWLGWSVEKKKWGASEGLRRGPAAWLGRVGL
jgi:hypothetical protein